MNLKNTTSRLEDRALLRHLLIPKEKKSYPPAQILIRKTISTLLTHSRVMAVNGMQSAIKIKQ